MMLNFAQMFKTTRSILVLGLLLSACSKNLELPDFQQATHTIPDPNKKGTCLMFITPDCPLSHLYAQPYQQLQAEFGHELEFLSVLPGSLYTEEEISHYVDSFRFNIPILQDRQFELVEQTSASTTPQFILMDNKGQILYSGAMDNWAISLARKRIQPTRFYFKTAITQYINHGVVTQENIPAIGCLIETR